MTNEASKLFSELVDVNWELSHAENEVVKRALTDRYWLIVSQLKEEMGTKEYYTFIENGRKMFS